MIKSISLLSLMLIAVLALSVVACTADDGATDEELADLRATSETTQSELDDANRRADEAEEVLRIATAFQDRVAAIKRRGDVVCATGNDTPGFHSLDQSGQSIGFDVDLCRAVAAAVLGDADAVDYSFIDLAARGPALQSGEIDIMNLTTTWTSTRDINWGNFGPVMFYDGQGFITRKDAGVMSARQLNNAAICVTSGTTTELNLADYFRQHKLNYTPTVFEQTEVAIDAYLAEQCDAFTTDRSGLAAYQSEFPNPDDHVILPEIISEEPLTTVIPHGDEAWFDIVKIVMAGIIYAEAYGIDSSNAVASASSDDIRVRRLLGSEGDFGQESLGLKKTFMQDVIAQVGNYGEIYERSLGENGIGLPRSGRNDLWINGGQIYAPPLR